MLSTNLRLLERLRGIVSSLQRELDDGDQLGRLAVANSILSVLVGREQPSFGRFLAQHYRDGLELLTQAPELSHALAPATENLRQRTVELPLTIAADGNLADTLHHHEGLRRALSKAIQHIDTSAAPRDPRDQWIRQTGEWEATFYARSQSIQPEPPISEKQPALTQESLQAYLQARFADRGRVRVNQYKILVGGMSRRTVLFEMEDDVHGKQSLVIRAEQPVNILFLKDMDITTEFGVLEIAYRAGIPAPQPLWLERDAGKLGMRFIVLSRLPGSNFGTVHITQRNLPPALLRNLVYGLRAIHRVDVEQYPTALAGTHLRHWTNLKSMQQATRFWVQTWYDFWHTIDGVSPLVEHGFDWLLANVPASAGKPTLLHSDYTLGNVLIDQEQVTAVLDWEASHLGDPAEELSTLIYNLRQQVNRHEILRLYREAGGPTIEEATLRYFEVFNVIKMLVCGFAGYTAFDRHANSNPNFYFVGDYCVNPFAPQLLKTIADAEAARDNS